MKREKKRKERKRRRRDDISHSLPFPSLSSRGLDFVGATFSLSFDPQIIISKIMSTKIRVIVSSLARPVMDSLPAHTVKVGLPVTRQLFTVLRSPFVHKKSREQFEIRTHKLLLDIKAERHELRQKLFWLKRHRLIGGQFEVQVFSKTRLDPKLIPLPQLKH